MQLVLVAEVRALGGRGVDGHRGRRRRLGRHAPHARGAVVAAAQREDALRRVPELEAEAGVGVAEEGGEVSVHTDQDLEKGEILLVVPESAMVAVSSQECGAIELQGGRRTMREVLDAIASA